MRGKKTLAWLLALGLVLSMLAGCVQPAAGPADNGPTPSIGHESNVTAVELAPVSVAAGYDEVRTALRACDTNHLRNPGLGATTDDFDLPVSDAAAADASAEGGAGYGDDSFGTNIQVAGIDEADDVKTDGDYLYLLNDLSVTILRADGADTSVVSEIRASAADSKDEDSDGGSFYYSNALLVQRNRLALIYTYNRWGTDENGNWDDVYEVHLAIYDTSNKQSPVLLNDVGQEGYYQSARMKDGTVYLITSDIVNNLADDAVPEQYIPRLYADGSYSLIPADHIYICPAPDYPSFTVVGVFDLENGVQTDVCAFTDSTDVVYMNADALYLARTVNAVSESEPYTENQYTVVDYLSQATTEIKRIPLTGETLAMDASCTLEGSLLNQFSLDVHDGYLRAATTVNTYGYSIFTDEAYGWENYYWDDESTEHSRVTVLDGDLNVVGTLEDLAEGEQIYSVRFLGEIGYVVTYESIDPVFTIDLSDPSDPTLESALEVSGVSQYLHLFSDGKLFGFGQALDESAASHGLQLSMFNVSDPKNVKLEGKEVLEDCYSEALNNHHAILVSGAENLIGFPRQDYANWNGSYAVYSYDNGSFTQRGLVELDYFADNARAISIDGCLYICGSYEVDVIDLTSFTVIAEVSSAEG